jgi:ABC-type Mn2+/Zn2+ transport system permease subunit
MPAAFQAIGWVLIAAFLFGAIAISIANPKRARFAIVAGTNLGSVPAVLVIFWQPHWDAAALVALAALWAIIYVFAPERVRNEHQPRVDGSPHDQTR